MDWEIHQLLKLFKNELDYLKNDFTEIKTAFLYLEIHGFLAMPSSYCLLYFNLKMSNVRLSKVKVGFIISIQLHLLFD